MRFAPFGLSVLLSTATLAPAVLTAPAHAQSANSSTYALTRVPVTAASGVNGAPFNTQRYLNVPQGFEAQVWARVGQARFMCALPNGDVLVSSPRSGRIVLLRPNPNDPGAIPTTFEFASGLRLPHDIVLATINGTPYIYVAESHQVSRAVYTNGMTSLGTPQVVIANLPDASSPELRGRYGHQLKNIAIGPDNRLYTSIASATNADPTEQDATPARGAVYVSDAEGRGFRLFALGLRNAEGLAFSPERELWVVVNNRDNIKYPYNDSTGWYGQVRTEYVDNHPPDEFTSVRDGAHYGWPFANPNPARGMDNMPFDPDYDTNRDWSVFPESTFTRIDKGIQAHSAPLGLTFTHNTRAETTLGAGAIVPYHGSWNRSQKTGLRVAFFPWSNGRPGAETDLVTGWINGEWGKPVDAAVSPRGDLYVSDDQSGTIYRVFKRDLPTEIIVDNRDAGVRLFGSWSRVSAPGGYGPDYLHDGNTQNKSVGFTPNLPVAGRYEVFARWPAYASQSNNTAFIVVAPNLPAPGYVVVRVNQQRNGQQWNSLGTYSFAQGFNFDDQRNPNRGTVWVINDARGWVIADAVKFVKVP